MIVTTLAYKKKNSLETLLNSFIESTSKTMQDILKKKMQMLENKIEDIEVDIVSLENKRVE